MSSANKLLQAASGNAGDKVYVEDVYSTFLYAGNDSTNQIQNGLDLSGEGGMVWIKSRSSGSMNNKIVDTERGVNKNLTVNYNYGQDTDASINSFNSDGFTLNTTYSDFNDTGHDYVAWSWRKQPGFFDIVTYTGNDTAGRTISHNLDSVPGVIVIKCFSHNNEDWYVYHRGMDSTAPEDYNMHWNQTVGRADENQMLNDTAPTATEFTVQGYDATNGTGKSYVAYLFAHDDQRFGDNSDEAIIKCGSYTGNNSADGPTVTLGYEPQWLLIKESSASGNAWSIYDMMRNGTMDQHLRPNSADAESVAASSPEVLPQATGFKLNTSSNRVNGNETYIYIAIRRPMKTPDYGTDVFSATTGSSSGALTFTSSFRVDLSIITNTTSGSNRYVSDRLRGSKRLFSDTTDAEATLAINWDRMTGWQHTSTGDYSAWTGWNFKRAAGFLDIVTYTGDGSGAKSFNHNLGVAPELLINKIRSSSDSWYVFVSPLGANQRLKLNENIASGSSSLWNSTAPTATQFTVASGLNPSGETFVNYLFATVAGVSKVGSYSGTGSTINVDCGFSSGARFVLIKRTDDAGNWFLYDSHRGINAAGDPYILLNSNSGQDSSNDDIDPLSSGFSIPSGSNVNTNGGTYIFLAIA